MAQEGQKAVERLVDRILAAKARDAGADASLRSEASSPQAEAELARLAEAVAKAEAEIDQLVYALYGLTPAEIQIVEGAAK